MVEARGPVRSAMCFRSILSRQNGLNRHMEQNILFWPKIRFFSFSACRAPIGPLCSWEMYFKKQWKNAHGKNIATDVAEILISNSHPTVEKEDDWISRGKEGIMVRGVKRGSWFFMVFHETVFQRTGFQRTGRSRLFRSIGNAMAFSAIPIYWEWAFSAIPIYWDWAFPMNGFWIFWLNGLGPHGAGDHMGPHGARDHNELHSVRMPGL